MEFELGLSYDELEVQMTASFTKTITETHVWTNQRGETPASGEAFVISPPKQH
jgi:hypothetical protein